MTQLTILTLKLQRNVEPTATKYKHKESFCFETPFSSKLRFYVCLSQSYYGWAHDPFSGGRLKIYLNLYIEITSLPYHSAWMAWMAMGPAFVLRHFKAHAVSSAQTLANTDLSVTKVSTAVLAQHKSMGYFFWTLVTLR